MRTLSKIFLATVSFFAVSGLSSCTWRASPQGSILVILVENLGFNAFSCSESGESGRRAGLQTFCEEGVRFTHAYTPSTLSQATIASIFTAQPPHQHGMRHNGLQTLPAKLQTVAETALTRGYRTSFFSGGPPVWRRFGLSQGFETFDDSVSVSLKSLYRSAPEVAKAFTAWWDGEDVQGKFLTFLFLSDLQFTDVATINELGEVRERSFASQREVIDESLGSLIGEMKRRKLWDSTDVFLVGLQAEPAEPRPDEIPAMNLMSDATRVTLMVKPARKARDGEGGVSWKVDANVSLVDVGTTLFDLIGADPGEGHSLKRALAGPQSDLPSDRLIVSESAWSQWRRKGTIRSAVRRGPYLFLFDEREQLFNTVTDSLEASPLARSDTYSQPLRARFAEYLRSLGYVPWPGPQPADLELALVAKELWRDHDPSSESLQRLKAIASRFPRDTRIRGWRAKIALNSRDWKDLKAAAGGRGERPDWEYVAARNLGEKTNAVPGPCFEFVHRPGALAKNCPEETLADLLVWANENESEEVRERAMDQFVKYYFSRRLAESVAEANLLSGERWDTVAFEDEPSAVDLVLALPEFRKIKAALRSRGVR